VRVFWILITFFSLTSLARADLWQPYEALLQEHVHPANIDGVALNAVDYPALRKDPNYPQAIQALATADLNALTSQEEKLAFYINAYNLLAIAVVEKHWPVQSIKDVGSLFWPVWKREAGVIAGKAVTLDEVEHQILRTLGEPRVHFAIVCASVSCPDLRREVFRAATLDSQLHDQTQRFLNNAEKGVQQSPEGVRISKIFSWFSEDFEDGVYEFIYQYRPELKDEVKGGYLPYNWQVNLLSRQ
jgi:hypothetical protein